MSWVATAIGGGAVVSGALNYFGSQNAANAEENAANIAAQTQMNIFNQEQADAKPYMQAGDWALGQLQGNMSSYNQPFTMNDFQNLSPEYGFDLSQGQKALTNSSAAQGGLVSGAQLAALNNYSQNTALNSYNSAFNNYQTQIQNSYSRLAGVAGMGAQTISGLNNNATQTGQNVGNNLASIGNAQAAGYVGGANAISGAINSGTQGYLGYSMLNQKSQAPGAPNMNTLNGSQNLTMPQLGSGAGYGSNNSYASLLAGD